MFVGAQVPRFTDEQVVNLHVYWSIEGQSESPSHSQGARAHTGETCMDTDQANLFLESKSTEKRWKGVTYAPHVVGDE